MFPFQDNNRVFARDDWYASLMLYNHRSGRDVSKSNDDIKLLPSVVERVLIPKITGLLAKVLTSLRHNLRHCDASSYDICSVR